ncbi:DUF5330 domain-containing protein [Methylobrevis albus]|uniref:DUF5330 domain-containing protein n=1 Tax=Methylobrevis albus TaxID=2793297 RepID=A0A931I0M1_9HYPH|nr:DUF5330 domain-containing protein [Methylobrevis albus]MBH0237164.1 DUF5330 domain-containing protein [Methylobrevis albus]
MFLIRTAFWLVVVIALIPVDEERVQASSSEPTPIAAGEAIFAAQALVADLGGFCDRNPSVCEVGGRVATTMTLKAKSGALMVYEYLGGADPLTAEPAEPPMRSAGTLTPADLAAAWRGA